MPQCSVCSSIFPFVSQLKLHFQFSHNSLTFGKFMCGEVDCSRSFDNWKSFRVHLLYFHKFQDDCNVSIEEMTPQHLSNNSSNYAETDNLDEVCNSDEAMDESSVLDSQFSISNFISNVSQSAEVLIAKLYAANAIPRNFIQILIDDFSKFLGNGFLEILKDRVLKMLNSPVPPAHSDISDIGEMFDVLRNPFQGLHTEHRRLAHFESCGYYVPPVSYTICENRPKLFNTLNGPVIKTVKTTGQMIPLRKTLKNFFELPGAFTETINRMNSLLNDQSNAVSNLIQCQLWQTKVQKYSKSDIVLPITLYYDEVECDNAIGPHSDKLGAAYAEIPVLPPYCVSKLENIFLALLIDGDDRKSLDVTKVTYNKEVFAPMIDEFNFLENEGIVCQTPDCGEKVIYFVLVVNKGDNLAVHGINGFCESFTSNFPCTICKSSKEATRSQTLFTDENLLRNRENYATDVLLKKVSETGIKEDCVFNEIESFHVTDNKVCDAMHDCAEGVSHYVLIAVLKHCVDSHYFTIDGLNSRLALFDYGPCDSSNKPPCIRDDFASKSKLKLTAREMFSLVRLLGVVVGDLVPVNDEYWHLYLLHKQLMDYCQSKHLPKDASKDISLLVHEHHSLYKRLTKRHLPPKFHYCTHYGLIFDGLGPFSLYSSMREEAKHRHLTNYMHAISSRRNPALSAAIKNQLMACFRYATRSPVQPELISGPGEFFELSDHFYYDYFKLSLPCEWRKEDVTGVNSTVCERVNWLDYMGTRYGPSMVLILSPDDTTGFIFGKIKDIFIYKNQPLFVCNVLETVGFCDHIGGFEVEQGTSFKCTLFSDLWDSFPLYDFLSSNGERYVVLKCYV